MAGSNLADCSHEGWYTINSASLNLIANWGTVIIPLLQAEQNNCTLRFGISQSCRSGWTSDGSYIEFPKELPDQGIRMIRMIYPSVARSPETGISPSKKGNSKLSVEPRKITQSRFCLRFDTWGNGNLHGADASWIVYPRSKPDCSSGIIGFSFDEGTLESKEVDLDIWQPKRVYAAIN
ncbi:hypothetical protein CIHG_08399 [Coccidioides immitis H538.4]|uniref:H-type lectin domain-containing protein n=1 Tax=Coccidioides immitis H538.4 TaxID=396776 RepID=A0A0J8RZA5_COCIT|nr:hypothetical protein CIHG_08399 [Coccidioides immitis H538.4]